MHEADDEVSIKQFVAVETLEEQGPVRAISFHPSGECYAVGSNSKVRRFQFNLPCPEGTGNGLIISTRISYLVFE